MALQAEKIHSNYEKHLKIIDHYIGDRKDACKKLIEHLGEAYIMAPASGKSWHHNAFPGGYIDHVNRVVEFAIKQMKLFKEMGGTIDFTEEELVFAAIFHDLGKIGDGDKNNYVIQTDEWRKNKLFEQYTYNPDLDFMLVPDRSLFILQKFGIAVTQNEFLGIRLHDGVFDKANEAYFFSNMPTSRMKTNIVYVLHSADFLASKVEFDMWRRDGGSLIPKETKPRYNQKKTFKSSKGLDNMLKKL